MTQHDRRKDKQRDRRKTTLHDQEQRITGPQRSHLRPGAPGYTPEAATDQESDQNPAEHGIEPAPLTQQRDPAEGPPLPEASS